MRLKLWKFFKNIDRDHLDDLYRKAKLLTGNQFEWIFIVIEVRIEKINHFGQICS